MTHKEATMLIGRRQFASNIPAEFFRVTSIETRPAEKSDRRAARGRKGEREEKREKKKERNGKRRKK